MFPISTFLKKYFLLDETFSFFLQVKVTFVRSNSESNNSLIEREYNFIFLQCVRPSFIYFVIKGKALYACILAPGKVITYFSFQIINH